MAEKTALMSILTKHSIKIFEGVKKWEFRKAPPRIDSSDSLEIIVYSSKVEKAIVGRFLAGRILHCSFDDLIKTTGYADDKAYVDWLFSYYKDKKYCSAIEILQTELFKHPISLDSIRVRIPSFKPPQNFFYIDPSGELSKLVLKEN